MAVVDVFQNQKEFRCGQCSGKILVPKELPPMTAPCPHCGSTITSPGLGEDPPAGPPARAGSEAQAILPPVKPAPPLAAKVLDTAASPFHAHATGALAQGASPAVAAAVLAASDPAAGRLLEAERALAAERARGEQMTAAIAAEKARAEERAAAIAAEKALAEEKARAAEQALAAEKALADQRAVMIATERALAEEKAAAEKALEAERALVEERARAVEKALAEEKARVVEKALAEERARIDLRAQAVAAEQLLAAEKELAAERARAAEQALAEQEAIAKERALAVEKALAAERAKVAEQSLARESQLAFERAVAEERAQAMERALAEERAQSKERERVREQALAAAAEKARAEVQARAAERALAAEKALAEERAAEIERVLAREKVLAQEKVAAAEKALAVAAEQAAALAAGKAREAERAQAAERALAAEKAFAEEKALAAERAQAQEKALAEERVLAEQKAATAERALAAAAEKAQAAERALAQERALARERALAAERALAEERRMAIAAEKALAEEKALAQQQAQEREKEVARRSALFRAETPADPLNRPPATLLATAEPASRLNPENRLNPAKRTDPVNRPPAGYGGPPGQGAPPGSAQPAAPARTVAAAAAAAAAAVDSTSLATRGAGTVPPAQPAQPSRPATSPPARDPRHVTPPPSAPSTRKAMFVPMVILLSLILAAGAVLIIFLRQPGKGRSGGMTTFGGGNLAEQRERQFLQSGWQKDARETLERFLAADTAAGKAAFSIDGSELLPRMDEFYGSGKIDDSDTALSGFSPDARASEDHKRGIFMMLYDQPPQFEMRDFFRPIAPLEVEFGLQEPDILLSSIAMAGNFTSEPVKVYVFFKRTPEGLRVDWETFVQTKYRTFRNFIELPNPGRGKVFRLFVVEDVPVKGQTVRGMKTYLLADPAHQSDSFRIDVPVDSELGRSLSILNWRGIKDGRRKTRTATLELEWTQDPSPQLAIKRFICWEFLGLGGQAVATPAGKR